MDYVAHRGAPALFTENTVDSIEAAARYKPAWIEFDIQATKDQRLVLLHNESLHEQYGDPRRVGDCMLFELGDLRTTDNQHIPTLPEALAACGDIPAAIEGKGSGWAKLLMEELQNHSGPPPIIISDNPVELQSFANLRPDLRTIIIRRRNPLFARSWVLRYHTSGVAILWWACNPWLYYRLRRNQIDIMLYTVPLNLTKLISRLYPHAYIVTNHINRLGKS